MSACSACLLRSALLAALAPRIDRAVDAGRGRTARDLLALGDLDLAAALHGSRAEAGAALASARAAVAGGELSERAASAGCRVLCAHDRAWPESLADLGPAAPRALFVRGEAAIGGDWLEDGPAVAVVGARRAGPYGIAVAENLAAELGAAGITVVSGLAFGVDTAAHQGALRRGLTVAVLGAGADRPYPRSRRRLYERIVASGSVISELPPGSPTFRWMFPARNRLMAALCVMTVVVEAAERSGSLITAEMAGDLGRTVGAVPGPVDSWRSAGANALLAEGALVVRDARDVLDAVLGPGVALAPAQGPPLRDDEPVALEAVAAGGGAGGIDPLVARTGLAFPALAAALGSLELKGYVRSSGAGDFRPTGLEPPERRHRADPVSGA